MTFSTFYDCRQVCDLLSSLGFPNVLCVSALMSPQEVTVGVLCLWQVRQLVKDGFLVEVSEGTRKLRHVFLFTDLLLCAKMKKTAVGYEHGHSHTTHFLSHFMVYSLMHSTGCCVFDASRFWCVLIYKGETSFVTLLLSSLQCQKAAVILMQLCFCNHSFPRRRTHTEHQASSNTVLICCM